MNYDKQDSVDVAYMLILLVIILLSASYQDGYILAASCSLFVGKQLGRINTTLRNK